MDASAATTAGAGVLNSNHEPPRQFHPPWQENVDDTVLTENDSVDITRVVAVDEEILIEEEEELGFSPQQEMLETFKLLLSGGIAGAFSKTATAPLARLTILYQVQGLTQHAKIPQTLAHPSPFTSWPGIIPALRDVIQREGFRALWKGNGVTIIHRLPYSAANFWTYEQINELWKQHIPSQGPLAFGDVTRRLVAGGTAGLAACSLAYPLDLIRTRLAAQTTDKYYQGIGHALKTIIKDEGALGLYRGLSATLLQVGPSLAINYAAYETTRSAWLAHTDRTLPTVGMSLTCGSIAGLISSTATFPLDLVRRRMQLEGQARTARVYSSYIGAFKHIIQREGLRGLYCGILPEYYKVIPGVAIAFCTYETMKHSLGVQTNATGR